MHSILLGYYSSPQGCLLFQYSSPSVIGPSVASLNHRYHHVPLFLKIFQFLMTNSMMELSPYNSALKTIYVYGLVLVHLSRFISVQPLPLPTYTPPWYSLSKLLEVAGSCQAVSWSCSFTNTISCANTALAFLTTLLLLFFKAQSLFKLCMFSMT